MFSISCIALCISLSLGVEFVKDNSATQSHVVINNSITNRHSFYAGAPSQTVDIIDAAERLNASFHCHFNEAAVMETEICLVS